jgi:hypothetical protein
MVELHHDGTVTVAADLAHGLGHGGGIAVNTQALQVVTLEAVALDKAFRQRRAADSPLDITAKSQVQASAGAQQFVPLPGAVTFSSRTRTVPSGNPGRS